MKKLNLLQIKGTQKVPPCTQLILLKKACSNFTHPFSKKASWISNLVWWLIEEEVIEHFYRLLEPVRNLIGF